MQQYYIADNTAVTQSDAIFAPAREAGVFLSGMMLLIASGF